MIKGFKDFIARGNVVELAVAVVMGAAFGAVVTALVTDIMTPFIAAIFGKPDFSRLFVTVHNSKILYGSFLNAVLAFLFVAIGVYFAIVLPMNQITARRKRARGLDDKAPQPTELELLAQIRDLIAAERADV